MRYLFILFSLFLQPLFSDESQNTFLESEAQTYNYWGEFVNMVMTLLFILALIFVSVWFLKKIMKSRLQHLNKSTAIKILERRPLNQKSSLYLVNILGKGVVIAESPAGIQKIAEFSEEINIEELALELHEAIPEPLSFTKVLSNKLRKLTSRNA